MSRGPALWHSTGQAASSTRGWAGGEARRGETGRGMGRPANEDWGKDVCQWGRGKTERREDGTLSPMTPTEILKKGGRPGGQTSSFTHGLSALREPWRRRHAGTAGDFIGDGEMAPAC